MSLDGQNLSIRSGGLAIAGTTLTITISDSPISLGASNIVIGISTYPLPSYMEAAPTQGLGQVMMSAFGPHTTASSAGATGIIRTSGNRSSTRNAIQQTTYLGKLFVAACGMLWTMVLVL